MTAVNRTRYIDGAFIKDYHTIIGTKRGGAVNQQAVLRRLGNMRL